MNINEKTRDPRTHRWTRLREAVAETFRAIHAIEFDAPWRRDDREGAHCA